MHKGFIFLLFCALLPSCAPTRHVDARWDGDRVRFEITPPGGSTLLSSPSASCLSCSEVLPPIPLDENSEGVATFKLEAAQQSIATQFRVCGAGFDTALFLQPRPEQEATKYYRLSSPVIGRIAATQLTHVYKDTTMSFVVGVLERGAEANLFRENDVFYFIHHPMYDHPVVVLRSSAIRLR
ncbi:MAG: hypothetical protein JSS75_03015 [Bacteroidetes bacterium]|nr:hypothetical protein [Bacteroidota bacterium]